MMALAPATSRALLELCGLLVAGALVYAAGIWCFMLGTRNLQPPETWYGWRWLPRERDPSTILGEIGAAVSVCILVALGALAVRVLATLAR